MCLHDEIAFYCYHYKKQVIYVLVMFCPFSNFILRLTRWHKHLQNKEITAGKTKVQKKSLNHLNSWQHKHTTSQGEKDKIMATSLRFESFSVFTVDQKCSSWLNLRLWMIFFVRWYISPFTCRPNECISDVKSISLKIEKATKIIAVA